jgi:ornithine carbamoyltransferase
MDVTVITNKNHWPSKYFLDKATELAKEKHTNLTITEDLDEIKNADVVATDTWISIWFKDQREQILKDLKGYTVTTELMKKAKPDAVFIHCMPIFYGEEVTREVAHGSQSVIIDEAENRMWAEMALMVKLLGYKK